MEVELEFRFIVMLNLDFYESVVLILDYCTDTSRRADEAR